MVNRVRRIALSTPKLVTKTGSQKGICEMAMTVRMLISKLKKMPPTAHVVWRDHDQSEDEMNGWVGCVEEAPDALMERRKEAGDEARKIVVLS